MSAARGWPVCALPFDLPTLLSDLSEEKAAARTRRGRSAGWRYGHDQQADEGGRCTDDDDGHATALDDGDEHTVVGDRLFRTHPHASPDRAVLGRSSG